MSSSASVSKENLNSFERRSRPRQSLPFLVVAFFENKNWGKLLEINEGGMSLKFAHPPTLCQQINFTFVPIARTGQAFGEKFEQAGEILWTRAFDRIAGVKFLDLAEPSRQQIRQWLSLGKPTEGVTPAQEIKQEAPTQVKTVAVEPTEAPTSPSEALPEVELAEGASELKAQESVAGSLPDEEPQLAAEVVENFKTQEPITEPTSEPEPLLEAQAVENFKMQEPIAEPTSEPDPLLGAQAAENFKIQEPIAEPTSEPDRLFAAGVTDNLDTLESTAELFPETEPLIAAQEPEAPPLYDFATVEEQAADEKGVGSNRRIGRTALFTSVGLLAALSVMGCVELIASFWRARSEAVAAKSAADPTVLDGSSRASSLPRESPLPFQVEVQDVSGKRWLLSFPRNGSHNGVNSDTARSALANSSSTVANKTATPEKASSSEKPEQARVSSFLAPKPSGSRGAATDSNVASMEAPALSAQLAFPPAELVPSASGKPALPAGASDLQRVGGEVQQARLVRSQPPKYPALAKANHVTGDVVMDAVIDPAGNVTEVTVISGPVLLRDAAMEALRKWKYEPAHLDGQPVATRLSVTLQFRID